jgi:hypothetical protein
MLVVLGSVTQGTASAAALARGVTLPPESIEVLRP